MQTVIALDTETTGKNPDYDQIIELSICVDGAGDDARNLHRRFRPTVPISPGAERVHGITNAELAAEPLFSECIDEIDALLGSADVIIGYNVSFDLRFLAREYQRAGRSLDLDRRLVVDPYRIWTAMEPRRLENAYERFVGGSLESAHSAEADTRATLDVLRGMRKAFDLESVDWDQLAGISDPDRARWVGPSRHLCWEGPYVVFGFGKHDGRPLYDVAIDDPTYIDWIEKSDFPKHVKNLCKGARSGLDREAFRARIAEVFPPPVADALPFEEEPA